MTRPQVINAVGFQLCWFACVVGGSAVALPAVSIFLLWHLRQSQKNEWWLIGLLSVGGILLDSAWLNIGLITFADLTLPVIPLWLALLWCAFSATLLHSLRWLTARPALLALAAAVSAPISYFAGSRLGALEISESGYVVIAISWALLMFIAATAWKKVTL